MNEEKTYILTKEQEIIDLGKYLNTERAKTPDMWLALDTEANGKEPLTATCIGYSISIYEDEGFYIPLLTWDKEKECLVPAISESAKKVALTLLAEMKLWPLVFHNAVYDTILLIKNYGLDLIDSTHLDTMLMKHSIDSRKPHGLKDCCLTKFGPEAVSEQEDLGESVKANGGTWNKHDKHIWKGDLDKVGNYAAKDTILTLRLAKALYKDLEELGLLEMYMTKEVMPLLKENTIPMKLQGFPVDEDYFTELTLQLEKDIEDLTIELYEEIADDITGYVQATLDKKYPAKPTSSFAEELCYTVGLEIPISPKTGNFSISEKVRKRWAKEVLKTASEEQIEVIEYILKKRPSISKDLIKRNQLNLFKRNYPDQYSPFNIMSTDQLPTLLKKRWGLVSPEKTKGGAPSMTEAILKTMGVNLIAEEKSISRGMAHEEFSSILESDELPEDTHWFIKYLRCKKLIKLLSTYVSGIQNLSINGHIHCDMLQHGTVTGRYASRNINMQNLPARSKLGLMIKRGFVAYHKN